MSRRRLVLSSAITLGAVILVFAATPAGRARIRATFLVLELVAPDLPSPIEIVGTESIQESVKIPVGDGSMTAITHRPSDGDPGPALILVLGYPSNIGDGDLARLAELLARMGYFVIIPRLPGLADGYLELADVEALVNVVTWANDHPAKGEKKLGMAGFCVGSSLALLATADERIADDVEVINVFGGYADLAHFIRAIAANSAFYNGDEYTWQPAEETVTLFVRNAIAWVQEPSEVESIGEALKQIGDGNTATADFSPIGRVVLALLSAAGPGEADAALAMLPEETKARLREMSPLEYVDQIQADVFVMHDRGDPYVPSVEASRLWEALDGGAGNTYSEFELFRHVRPDGELKGLALAHDALALVNHLSKFFYELES